MNKNSYADLFMCMKALKTQSRHTLCSALYLVHRCFQRSAPDDFSLNGTDGVWSAEVIRGINRIELGMENGLSPVPELEAAMTQLSSCEERDIRRAASLCFLWSGSGALPEQGRFSINADEYQRARRTLEAFKAIVV